MNRRGFLGSLAAFAATVAIDPEKLLWTPGEKTISIPSGIVMPEIRRGAIVGVATQDIVAGQYGTIQIYGLVETLNDGVTGPWNGSRYMPWKPSPKLNRYIKAGKTFVRGDFVYAHEIEYGKHDSAAPPWYDLTSEINGANPVFRNGNTKTS